MKSTLLSTQNSFICPDWPSLPKGMRALSTTRRGGVSRAPYDDGQGGGGLNFGERVGDDPAAVAQNRASLQSQLNSPVIFLSQIHGNIVIDADEWYPGVEADAIVSSKPWQVCAIQTADCLPVLFAAKNGAAIGAAHAGWRGLARGVLQNTVRAMRARGAQEICAWLGPAIGPEKFEVGAEVKLAFEEALGNVSDCFVEQAGGKFLADLYRLAGRALLAVDVSDVAGGGFCTYTDRERFYSYRRDLNTGRMATLIWWE